MAKKPTSPQAGAPTDAAESTATGRMPLNKIIGWPHNPRRTRDQGSIEQRAKNLLTQGQIMPILVVASGTGDLHFAVDGEGRRLAMNINVANGQSEPDMPVDVRILDASTPLSTLIAIAMAVNIDRDEMNPIEQMEGYAAMQAAGMKPRDIADMHNISIRQVAQRLSLGNLIEPARNLVRDRTRSIAWAEAMTVGSKTQQERVVAEIEANPSSYPDRLSVHNDFVRGNIPAESALFDPELLRDHLVTDLFSHGTGGGSFNDREAFWKLQLPEVAKIKQRLDATHKEVRVHDRTRFNSAGWSTGGDPKTSVAVVVTFDDGSVAVHEGMVPPAYEMNAPAEAATADEGSFLDDGETFSDDLSAAAEAPTVRIETGPLDSAGRETVGYLNAQVVSGLKVHVASDARKAMAFVIASTLTRNGGLASSMQINGVGIDPKQQTSESFVRLAALRARRDAIAKSAGVLGVTSPARVVAALLEMDESEMAELFAWTVAESVSTPLQASTFELVEALGSDPMPGWTIENAYLDTLSSAQVRALASEVVPVSDQPSRNATVTQVRNAIVQAVEEDSLQNGWSGGGWIPPQVSKPRDEARRRADEAAATASGAGTSALAAAA